MVFQHQRTGAFKFTCGVIVSISLNLCAQTDPGPRGGSAGAGGYYSKLNASEQAFFTQALQRFQEVDSVSGTVPGESGVGLGPTFNGNSCAMCHSQPAVGGSSPGLTSPQNPVPNPQVALATLNGAANTVPSFITAQGPVREARFVTGPNQRNLDGGVHGLFTIQGRTDANGCQLSQPDFATQLANHNVIFRIPTPTFGLGLVENTPDATLQANLAANQDAKAGLGIAGVLNTSGNDGTVTRFGWKAQNKSLLIFSGEAYNVELGVSNEAFPNERSATAGCVYNATPEDSSNILNPTDQSMLGTASQMSSDIVNFAAFMRLSAPAMPTTASPSEIRGQALFNSIGCALCHSPSLTTASSPFTGMSYVTYQPFSDFALHHMGSNLADGINQGLAGPDQFRTAPLWGVGQRLFFLHDGRTSDLLAAIEAHASDGGINCGTRSSSRNTNCASEANGVISNFDNLTDSQQQDILNFLRSL
ncbi:MAG: thiol oxidoreductase [Acidobacteriaceae bacterium]|nr:thiol oxidoreductase [Acidobacteriaceae bacterium]